MTDLQKRISAKVRQLGASCGLKGFEYIKTAVELVYNDESYLHSVTKRLYPETAKIHRTKSCRIERNIRHFIERVYDCGGACANDILGVPPDMRKGTMTVSNFIAALVESLKCEE